MAEIKKWLWWWLPVLVWCGLIFWWSSIPHLAIATGWADFWTRKPAHVAEYTVLFLLLYRAIRHEMWREWLQRVVLVAAILTVVYAASDEWHQHFVPSRGGHVLDVAIDFLGVLVGMGILRWWQWWDRVTMEKV